MDVTEMVILDEHAAAVAVASEALELPMQVFEVRVCATARVDHAFSIEAIDTDHAEQLVKLMTWRDRDFEYDPESSEISGDEIAYINAQDEETYINERVVDLKFEDEPFSWDACELVRELAKVETCTTTLLNEFVHKARELCKGGRKKPVDPV
jgi:hypothetical protein